MAWRSKIKPRMWGPPPDVQYAVRDWCENKLGAPAPLFAYIFWEKTGKLACNYGSRIADNATLIGGAVENTKGLVISGENQYAAIDYPNNYAFAETRISIFSMYEVSDLGRYRSFIGLDDSIGARCCQARISNSNHPEFIAFVGGSPYTATGTSTISAGTPYSYCGTYDGETAVVYHDGVEDGSNASPSGDLNSYGSSDPIWIGARWNDYHDIVDYEFYGTLYNIILFNSALTADQVTLLNARPNAMFEPVLRPKYFFLPTVQTVEGELADTAGINDQLSTSGSTFNTDTSEESGINDSFSVTGVQTGNIADDAGVDDQLEAVNLTGKITDESGVDDQVDAVGTFGVATSEESGIADQLEVVSLTDELPEGFSINDQAQRVFETNQSISNISGISDAFECLNWTQWLAENDYKAIKLYYFTLTGDADSTTDIEIPISSFQCRLRSGDPTYLSVVIPGIDYASQINARPNGDLVIDMAYRVDGAIAQREEIARVTLESIRIDRGSTNKSITLSGHKTETFGSKIVTLADATYRRSLNGKLTYRTATPDLFLKPGDTVKYDTDEFTAGLVSYTVSAIQQQMEVTEA